MLEPGESFVEVGRYQRSEPDRGDGRERRRRLRRDRQLRDERRLAQGARGEHRPLRPRVPTIIEGDAFQAIPSGALAGKTVAVYYYDNGHTYEKQLDGLRMIEPWLADRALLIVDDTDWSTSSGDTRLPRTAAARSAARLDPRQGQRLPRLVGGREGARVGVGRGRHAARAEAAAACSSAWTSLEHPGVLADDRDGVAVCVEPVDVDSGPPTMKSTCTVESFSPSSLHSSGDISSPPSTAFGSDWPNAMCEVAFSSKSVLRNVSPVRPTRESPSTSASSPSRREPSSVSTCWRTTSSPLDALTSTISPPANRSSRSRTIVPREHERHRRADGALGATAVGCCERLLGREVRDVFLTPRGLRLGRDPL